MISVYALFMYTITFLNNENIFQYAAFFFFYLFIKKLNYLKARKNKNA